MRLNFDLRIFAFSAANFAVGTGAFIISGILPMVAGSLNCTIFEIGQTATAFSIAFAIGGSLLAGPTSRIDRRTLLVGGLLLFTLAAVSVHSRRITRCRCCLVCWAALAAVL